MVVDTSSNIFTVDDYWDCECLNDNYIHPKSQMLCPECGKHQDDMPDSRLNELLRRIFDA